MPNCPIYILINYTLFYPFSLIDLASEEAGDLPRPEEHRETAVSKQVNLQQQLKVCYNQGCYLIVVRLSNCLFSLFLFLFFSSTSTSSHPRSNGSPVVNLYLYIYTTFTHSLNCLPYLHFSFRPSTSHRQTCVITVVECRFG